MPRSTSTGTTSFSANTNKDHEQDREELQELKWQRLEHYSVQYPIPKGHADAVNTGYRGDMFIANAISKFYSPYNEDFSKRYTRDLL